MLLYLFLFFIPVFYFLFTGGKGDKNTHFLGYYLFGLGLFVGLGDMMGGYDRYIYAEYFDVLADDLKSGANIWNSPIFVYGFSNEKGYGLINLGIAVLTSNRYIFILILTLIIYTLLFFSLKKYANNYPFALILFMGLWFYFTFTYLRQVLGATVCWLAIDYIIQRKKWQFFLIIFIAYTIHNSAIVFLPLYFIPIKKFHKNTIIITMVFLFLLGLTNIVGALYSAYGAISDSAMQRIQGIESHEGSFRFAYLVEALFFLYFIFTNYDKVGNTKRRIVFLNIAIFFCGTLLTFIRSENGGRISWYYMIGIIVTMTYIFKHVRNKQNYSIFIIIVCLFLNMRIFRSWQVYHTLYPYKTFLTNGPRLKNDVISDYYEYDHNYDKNKFYR
jgi:hypothetical protein